MTAPLKIDPARCLELAAWAREVAQVRDEDVVAGADAEAKARTRENMAAIADQLDAAVHAVQRWLAALDELPTDGGEPGRGQTTAPRHSATQQGAATPGQGATAEGAVPGRPATSQSRTLDPTAHRAETPPSVGSFAAALSSPAFGELVKAGLDAQVERTERGLRWVLGDAAYEEMRARLGHQPGAAEALLPREPAPAIAHDFLPPLDPPSPRIPTTEELRALQSPATVGQPRSVPSDGPAIVDLVVSDLRERAQHGEAKYGVRLQPHNGRVALVDLYQELLDAVQYIRQEIEERRLAAERAR